MKMISRSSLKLLFYSLTSVICLQTVSAQFTPAPRCESTGHRCITIEQCSTQADGPYQWCGGCEYYVQCTGQVGQLYSTVLPQYTQWDDNRKNFQTTSATCVECYHPCPPGPSAPAESPCTLTGLGCVNDTCPSSYSGNYQYCGNCNQYVTCHITAGYNRVSCSGSSVYDDFLRTCTNQSTTCRECYQTCFPPTTQPPATTSVEQSTVGDPGVGGDRTTAGGPDGGDEPTTKGNSSSRTSVSLSLTMILLAALSIVNSCDDVHE